MPAFSALDRWRSLEAVIDGQPPLRQARGDTEGLAALVNAVARSATTPGEGATASVDLRLELHGDAGLLAVLEVAGDQVRWLPQPGGAGFVGTPPASALAALRAALAGRR